MTLASYLVAHPWLYCLIGCLAVDVLCLIAVLRIADAAPVSEDGRE